MVSNIGIPIEYVIISLFIGYLYYYLTDVEYREILSWTSLKIGSISGLLLAVLAGLIGLMSANVFSWDDFFVLMIFVGIPCMIIATLLVIMGGYFAITTKRILNNL